MTEDSSTVRASELAPVTAGFAASTAWSAFLGLLTTPYLLHRLGASAYAVFALINLIVAYLTNLEFGFGHGTIRFLARARAQGDRDAEARVFGTSLTVFYAAAAVAALITFFGAPLIVKSFADFPPSVQGDAVVAVRVGSLVIAGTLLNNLLTGALSAIGRFSVLIKFRFVFGTLLSGGAVAAAAVFDDVGAVLVVQAVVILGITAYLFWSFARATTIPLRPSFHVETFKTVGAFSLVILGTGLATQAMIQGPPTVLAGGAPSHELAAFAVPALITQQLTLMVGATTVGFLPFASGQSAYEDRTHLSEVFNSHVRLTLMTMGPIAGFLAVFAYPLLAAWVGASFASEAATPLRLLGVAALFLVLSSPPADVARALGKPSWTLVFAFSAAAIGIGVAVPAVAHWQATGAALGFLVGLGVTTPILLIAVATRLLHIAVRDFLVSLARPLLAILGATLLYALAALVQQGFLTALLAGAIITPAYVSFVWRVALSDRERQTLRAGLDRFAGSIRALVRRPRTPLVSE